MVEKDKEIGIMLPLRIYASENLIPSLAVERSTDQAITVSTLTGVKGAGVISPGRVGYDINCGVR